MALATEGQVYEKCLFFLFLKELKSTNGQKSNKTVPPPIGEKWLPARDLLCNESFRPLKNLRILNKIDEFSIFQKNYDFLQINF